MPRPESTQGHGLTSGNSWRGRGGGRREVAVAASAAAADPGADARPPFGSAGCGFNSFTGAIAVAAESNVIAYKVYLLDQHHWTTRGRKVELKSGGHSF